MLRRKATYISAKVAAKKSLAVMNFAGSASRAGVLLVKSAENRSEDRNKSALHALKSVQSAENDTLKQLKSYVPLVLSRLLGK